jgi:hypothetical protein
MVLVVGAAVVEAAVVIRVGAVVVERLVPAGPEEQAITTRVVAALTQRRVISAWNHNAPVRPPGPAPRIS